LECTYPLSYFSNNNGSSTSATDAVTNWKDYFINPSNQLISEANRARNQSIYDEQIMPYFCSADQEGDSCPEGYSRCSRFVSTGNDGTLCREWAASSSATKNKYNEIANERCSRFNTPDNDCGCINRRLNSTYTNISNAFQNVGYGQSAFCWWADCSEQDRTKQLVPFQTTDCNATLCIQFVKQIAGGNISTGDINTNISCGTNSRRTSNQTVNNIVTNIFEFFTKNPAITWILISVVIVLTLIIFIFAFRKK